MTYTESAQLERNTWFVERVRVCVSTYTNYLLNTAVEDPLYAEKQSVATRLARENSMVMNTIMFTLQGDSEIQAAGPAIPDPQLQQIVEKTIVKFYPVQAAPALGMTPQMMPYRPPAM